MSIRFRKTDVSPAMIAVFVAGVLLRAWYFAVTPIAARSHDMGTHLDYVKYVAEHWALPPVHAGWEFHQAPLYYIGSAILWTLNAAAGFGQETAIPLLRFGSLLFSIAAFAVALRIGWILLKDRRERLTFGALLAAFPGLLYLTGEISNEAPHHALIFLEFLLLLRWWKSGTRRDLIILSVLIGLGILVKVSSVLMALALIVCILMRPAYRQAGPAKAAVRWKSFGIAALTLTLICGWFVALRVSQRGQVETLLSNNETLPTVQNAIVDNNLSYFLQFWPPRVVGVPFNSVWDTENRVYFWEYLFRSAWFGEWAYDDVRLLVQGILILGMLLLLTAFYGMVRDFREQPVHAFPMALTAFLLPFALLCYRIAFPCSWNQDFRFIPLFCIPMAYYAVRGVSGLPGIWKTAGFALAWAMTAATAAFILLL